MKKINSEIGISDNQFKVKICTTNKKNPETIYIEIGSYIMPLKEMEYESSVNLIEKDVKNRIKSFLDTTILSKDFILVTDLATDRMAIGKKSYLDMQLHVKPTLDFLKSSNRDFKEITKIINTNYIPNILPYIKNRIREEGFECSKTKN